MLLLLWLSVGLHLCQHRFVTLKEKEDDKSDCGGALKRSRTNELGAIKVEWSDCVETGKG